MRALAVVIPLLCATIAYRGVLGCYFWQDDFYWLFRWLHVPVLEFLLEGAPGHLLPVRNGIVAATAAVVGFDPTGWFATVLVAHAVTAFALCLVLQRWTGTTLLASAVASVWAIAPLHAGTLGWYSAATHGWSTLAVTGVLLALPPSGAPHRVWAAVASVVAAMTFGTGLAIVLVGPWLVWLLRPNDRATILLSAMLAVGAGLVYVLLGTGHRSVLADPVVTRAMALDGGLDHPRVALELAAALLWVGAADLGGGPVGVAALLGLVIAGLIMPSSRRLVVVGLTIAGTACGAVAVGRAGLVGTLKIPLWQVAGTTHYHYSAQLGIALAAGVGLAAVCAPVWRRVAATGLLAIVAARLLTGPVPVDTHDSAREAMRIVEREARRAAVSGRVVPNRAFPPALTLILFGTPDRFPGYAAAFTLLARDGLVDGRPVRFRANSWAEHAAVRGGGPIARVLTPPVATP